MLYERGNFLYQSFPSVYVCVHLCHYSHLILYDGETSQRQLRSRRLKRNFNHKTP